ncbi:MAG TPA: hypothetical protein DEF89_01575 [Desulfosporosinus sp.]|nr:hypothetical protein [Desulfosporosinus sp.]
MALNNKTSPSLMPITIVFGIAFVGILILKFDIKGDKSMNRFFAGKAVGTIIVFGLLGIYLLLKYVLHLF